MRQLYVVVLALLVVGCSPVTYKRAALSGFAGQQGYLDRKIADGEYVIEVAQIGGYQFIIDEEAAISTLVSHWKRRASERCPAGYTGEYKVITPINARIQGFRCARRFCQDYPMVSGVVTCYRGNEI